MKGKVGFLVWNKFQYLQIREILKSMPDSELIIWFKKDLSLNSFEKVNDCKNSIRFVTQSSFANLDGQYDLIVSQNRLPYKTNFESTKLGMMQYSFAKDYTVHNIRWTLADVAFVYGQYTYDNISLRCPTIQIGNPRFSPYFNNELEGQVLDYLFSHLDKSKKTLIYMTTWGDLSSEELFGKSIKELSIKYNIIQKVHHLAESDLLVNGKIVNLDKKFKKIIDESLYVLKIGDLVMSDYSGSIFDALYLDKPVILLRNKSLEVGDHPKMSSTSIEIEWSSRIGPVVYNPEILTDEVEKYFNNVDHFSELNNSLVEECFKAKGDSTQLMVQGINDYLAGKYKMSRGQRYLKYSTEEVYFQKSEPKTMAYAVKWGIKKIYKYLKPFLGKPSKLFDKAIWAAFKVENKLNIDIFTKNFIKYFEGILYWKNGFVFVCIEYYFAKQDYRRAIDIYKKDFKFYRIYPTALTKSLIKMKQYGLLGVELEKWLLLSNTQKLSRLNHYESVMGELNYSNDLREEVRRSVVYEMKESLKTNYVNKTRTFSHLITAGYLHVVIDIFKKYKIKNLIIENRIQFLKSFLGELEGDIDVASTNGLLSKEDKLVIVGDQQSKYSDIQEEKILELYIPSSFLYKQKLDSSRGVREQMLHYYTNLVKVLKKYKIAYVPILQHGWNVKPIDKENYIFSHHTLGGSEKHFHIKISALKGYISFDRDGFAGWATVARDIPENRASISAVNDSDAEKVWEVAYKEIVGANQSKYAQPESSQTSNLDNLKYVFLPLQVTGDLVAELAYLSGVEVADYLCEKFKNTEYKVVIKRHPLCTDNKVEEAIKRLSANEHIIISNASVHDLIKNASLVITVNSGVGMESLLHLKKVLITGGADYFYGVSTAKSISDLDQFFEQSNWWDVDESEIKKFLYFYLRKYLIDVTDSELIESRLLELGIHNKTTNTLSSENLH